ncbi:MAG: TIGR01777 family oxidoreductase [Verrucomicrobiota bacterium]
MKILITGGTGLIGRPLCQRLIKEGQEVTVLTRSPEKAKNRLGKEVTAISDLKEFQADEKLDAVINLAGEGVADQYWTDQQKERIRTSRIAMTQSCVNLIGRLESKPSVLLNASAIGYYGTDVDGFATESTPPGEGFLPEVSLDWEKEALKAEPYGVRVCLMRIGVVLAPDGGAYAKMKPPFQFKVAGQLGDGKQGFSWIHRDDVIRGMLFLLNREELSGPFNFTAPHPVSNAQFTQALSKVMRCWFNLPAPSWFLKLVLGEMAEEVLLKGALVEPQALLKAGYTFLYSDLQSALENLEA